MVILPLVDVVCECVRALHTFTTQHNAHSMVVVVNNPVSCSMINEHTECNYKNIFYYVRSVHGILDEISVWNGFGCNTGVNCECSRFSMFHRIIIISFYTHICNSCQFIHMLWLSRAFLHQNTISKCVWMRWRWLFDTMHWQWLCSREFPHIT